MRALRNVFLYVFVIRDSYEFVIPVWRRLFLEFRTRRLKVEPYHKIYGACISFYVPDIT